MTRERYIEMCESMGTEPDLEEIPPSFMDLSGQTQDILEIFKYLPDIWGSMGGYVGKDLNTLPHLLQIFDIPESDWLLHLELLQHIVLEQTAFINKKVKEETRKKTGGKTNRTRSSNTG